MSETFAFNKDDLQGSVQSIDVRADGKTDGKKEQEFENQVLEQINQLVAEGASDAQLKKAFDGYAAALMQRYEPSIKAAIAQVEKETELATHQAKQSIDGVNDGILSGGVKRAKDMLHAGCDAIPGETTGNFLKGVIDELMTMPEMLAQLAEDPWTTIKSILSCLNPRGENFLPVVLVKECGTQLSNLVTGDAYAKGRAIVFTAMTVLPFFPKGGLVAKLKGVLKNPGAFALNKNAILKAIKSVDDMVTGGFVGGKNMFKMGVRSVDDLCDLLKSAGSKTFTMDQYLKLGLNSFDELSHLIKSPADFKTFLDNFDDVLKPQIIQKLGESIKTFHDLKKIGIKSVDDLDNFRNHLPSTTTFDDFLKYSKFSLDDAIKLCKSAEDVAKLCGKNIDNLTTLFGPQRGVAVLQRLKINSLDDFAKNFGTGTPPKLPFDKVKALLDQTKLFDEIKALKPRNVDDLINIGIDTADALADLVKPGSPKKLFQLGVDSVTNLRRIVGINFSAAPEWLQKVGLENIDKYDEFINDTITKAKNSLDNKIGSNLATGLKELDIIGAEKLKNLLDVSADNLVAKGIRGKQMLNDIGIHTLDDLKNLKNTSITPDLLNKLLLNSADDLLAFGVKSVDDLKKILKDVSGADLSGQALKDGIRQLGLRTKGDLLKLGVKSTDDLLRLEIKGIDMLIQRGIKSIDDLKQFGVSADDLLKLEIKSIDDLSKIGIASYQDLLKLGPISNGTTLLEHLSITGRQASFKFGLKTIDDFGQIGIRTVDDLKKIITELGTDPKRSQITKELFGNADTFRKRLAGQSDTFTGKIGRGGKVVSKKANDINAIIKHPSGFKLEDFFENGAQMLDFDQALDVALGSRHTNFVNQITSHIPHNLPQVRDRFVGLTNRGKSFLIDRGVSYTAYIRNLKSMDIGTKKIIYQILKDSGSHALSLLKTVPGTVKGITSGGLGYALQAIKGVGSYVRHYPLVSLYGANKIDGLYSLEEYNKQTSDIEHELESIKCEIEDYEAKYANQESNIDCFIDGDLNGQKGIMESGKVVMDYAQQLSAQLGICNMIDVLKNNKDLILHGPDHTYCIDIVGMSSITGDGENNQ